MSCWNKGYLEDPLPPAPKATTTTFTTTAYLHPQNLFMDTSDDIPHTRPPSIRTLRASQPLRSPLPSHSSSSYKSSTSDLLDVPADGGGVIVLGPNSVTIHPGIEEINTEDN